MATECAVAQAAVSVGVPAETLVAAFECAVGFGIAERGGVQRLSLLMNLHAEQHHVQPSQQKLTSEIFYEDSLPPSLALPTA